MATFTDTIKLVLNLDVDGSARGGLKGIRDDIDQTDGAWGKMKAGAGGAFDFVKENAAGFALGAGAAIGGFALKAVGDFQDIALETGHLRDALGLTSEEASRWIEVAGDMGISTGTIESAIGKMNKTAGSSPGVFKELGVQIAYAKDGTIDANGTFLNVIGRLNEMKDPAERAAAAQQLLGKSWRDASELIGLGADGVKAKLAEVSDAKIIGDSQVQDAKDLRDSLDDLKDSGEDLTLTLGRTLLPMLANIADAAGKIAGPVADLIAQAGDIADTGDEAGASFWDQFKGGIARSVPLFSGNGAWDLLGIGKEDIDASVGQLPTALDEAKVAAAGIEVQAGHTGAAVERMRGMFGVAIPTTEEMTAAQEASAAKAKQQADGQDHLNATMAAVNERLKEQADALAAQHDEAINAADATLAVNEAQQGFIDKVTESNQLLKDGKGDTEEFTQSVDGERDAMIEVAKRTEEANRKHAEAKGETYGAQQAVDDFNASLLNNAHFATPAARDAIANYIIEANSVPESKSTDIRAAIAAGDFDLAATLLSQLSATRRAAINADAITGQAEHDINYTARDRTVRINASFGGGSDPLGSASGSRHAGGGDVKAGEATWVGDKYGINSPSAELFVPDVPGHIYNQDQLKRHAGGTPGGTPRGGGQTINYITINTGADPNAVVTAIKKYERNNGSGWRAS